MTNGQVAGVRRQLTPLNASPFFQLKLALPQQRSNAEVGTSRSTAALAQLSWTFFASNHMFCTGAVRKSAEAVSRAVALVATGRGQ
jgi:hypothetical protein